MRVGPTIAGAIILCALHGFPVDAGRQPSRGIPVEGTARVAGWTVSPTGEPIAGVEVGLPCPPQRVRYVQSDASGRFEITGLPEGNCRLIARKDGYVEATENGEPARGGYGIRIRAGETRDGFELRLARGAIVSGVIRADGGPPPDGVTFQLLRRDVVAGIEKLVPLGYAPVRQGGAFQTAAVPPGEYFVVAQPPRQGLRGRPGGFAVSYFPGTAKVSDAQALALKAGERRHVEFPLVTAATHTISGVVHDSSGAPLAGASVGVSFDTPPQWIRGSATTAADGTFSISGLQDGSYVLRTGRKNAAGRQEMAEAHIDVRGADLQHVILRMSAR